MRKIKIQIMDGGKLPEKKTKGAACFDCYARLPANVPFTGRCLVPLGFALQLPRGYEAVIRPRSGFSAQGVDIAIGTIDADYRGEVSACVCNLGKPSGFIINAGDRVCQIKIQKAEKTGWKVVKKLSKTARGKKGFGSTGVSDGVSDSSKTN